MRIYKASFNESSNLGETEKKTLYEDLNSAKNNIEALKDTDFKNVSFVFDKEDNILHVFQENHWKKFEQILDLNKDSTEFTNTKNHNIIKILDLKYHTLNQKLNSLELDLNNLKKNSSYNKTDIKEQQKQGAKQLLLWNDQTKASLKRIGQKLATKKPTKSKRKALEEKYSNDTSETPHHKVTNTTDTETSLFDSRKKYLL